MNAHAMKRPALGNVISVAQSLLVLAAPVVAGLYIYNFFKAALAIGHAITKGNGYMPAGHFVDLAVPLIVLAIALGYAGQVTNRAVQNHDFGDGAMETMRLAYARLITIVAIGTPVILVPALLFTGFVFLMSFDVRMLIVPLSAAIIFVVSQRI